MSSDFGRFHSQTASEDGTEGKRPKLELVPYSDVYCILYIYIKQHGLVARLHDKCPKTELPFAQSLEKFRFLNVLILDIY